MNLRCLVRPRTCPPWAVFEHRHCEYPWDCDECHFAWNAQPWPLRVWRTLFPRRLRGGNP